MIHPTIPQPEVTELFGAEGWRAWFAALNNEFCNWELI